MLKRILVVMVCGTVAGCMSGDIANTKKIDASAAQRVKTEGASLEQVCAAAGDAIVNGNEAELKFYSPLHMEQAADIYDDSKSKPETKEETSKYLTGCYKVQELIDGGLAIKEKALTTFKQSFDQLAHLKKLDTSSQYTDDLEDFRDDIRELIVQLEAGKVNEASKEQAELMTEMIEFEIDVKLTQHLDPVKDMLDKAEDEDAEDWAEKSYEKAEKVLERAEGVIRKHFRNLDSVQKTAREAMMHAAHAYHVAKEAKTLKGMKPEQAEDQILKVESYLQRINQVVNDEPVIGHSLYDQAEAIAKRVEALKLAPAPSAPSGPATSRPINAPVVDGEPAASTNEAVPEASAESEPEVNTETKTTSTDTNTADAAVEVSQDEVKQDEVNQDEVNQDEVKQNNTNSDDTNNTDASPAP